MGREKGRTPKSVYTGGAFFLFMTMTIYLRNFTKTLQCGSLRARRRSGTGVGWGAAAAGRRRWVSTGARVEAVFRHRERALWWGAGARAD